MDSINRGNDKFGGRTLPVFSAKHVLSLKFECLYLDFMEMISSVCSSWNNTDNSFYFVPFYFRNSTSRFRIVAKYWSS